MSEIRRVIRDTLAAASLVGLLAVGTGCGADNESAAQAEAEHINPFAPGGEDNPLDKILPELSPEDREAMSCELGATFDLVLPEHVMGEEPTQVAMGVRFYREVTSVEGDIPGTEVIFNPGIAPCPLEDGSEALVLNAIMVGELEQDGESATAIINTSTSMLKRSSEGVYEYWDEDVHTAIVIDESSPARGSDGSLDTSYTGEETWITTEGTKLIDDREVCAPVATCRGVVTEENSVPVMWREFYPDKTIDDVRELHEAAARAA